MFDFCLKYFGFLKHAPLMPHLFDAMLKMEKALTKPEVLGYIDDIEMHVLSWKGLRVSTHRLGGIQFNVNGKEIGHIHGNGMLDILFSRNISEKLISENKASEHHIHKQSGWISFLICNERDKARALELLEFSLKLKTGS